MNALPDQSKMIRKLGNTESVYDNEVLNGNFLLATAILASIDAPYAIDKHTMNKAAHIWCKKHKLLQASIYRTGNELNVMPKYFMLNKSTATSDFKNIELVEEKEQTLLLTHLIESELKKKFDANADLYWRMKIVKSKRCQVAGSSEYSFIFTIHHSLADGKNAYAILVEYLHILQCLFFLVPIFLHGLDFL